MNEKEKVALEIARLEDKKMNVQKEYDAIIAKLWDEYELTRREAAAEFEVLESTPQVLKELNELLGADIIGKGPEPLSAAAGE